MNKVFLALKKERLQDFSRLASIALREEVRTKQNNNKPHETDKIRSKNVSLQRALALAQGV